MVLKMYSVIIGAILLQMAVAGPTRECLDDCVCDDVDEVIRCDHGTRASLEIPNRPLYGYKFIAFTCNDLRELPSENLLKAAFPHLEGIDVQGNLNFDCSTAKDLKEISVMSDCGSEEPTTCKINENCDWKCSSLKKLKELWHKVKTVVSSKYKEIGGDKAVAALGNWFSNAYRTITSN